MIQTLVSGSMLNSCQSRSCGSELRQMNLSRAFEAHHIAFGPIAVLDDIGARKIPELHHRWISCLRRYQRLGPYLSRIAVCCGLRACFRISGN
jgi:hypothetical protein